MSNLFQNIFTRLSRKDATLAGWEDYVSQRSTSKSRAHGKVAEDALVLRMGGGSVSEVAFRQYFPSSSIRWIDETNRGSDSIANGAGCISLDGILPEPRTLGGGIAFQMKAVSSVDKTEVVCNGGNFSTIAAVLDTYRGHFPANRVRLPIVLVHADVPPVGHDPRGTKVRAFAVIDLIAFVRQMGQYSGVVYPEYTWDAAAGVHVRNPAATGRGVAALAPLRVTWGKGNGGKQTYARLVLSLRHPAVRAAIRWVDTSDLTDEEAASMMADAIRHVGKRG